MRVPTMVKRASTVRVRQRALQEPQFGTFIKGGVVAARDDSRLIELLAHDKTYLWALQYAYADDLDAAKAALAEAGIDERTLLALRRLEPSIARVPQPVAHKPDHRYL